jgi:hypothetical protein
VSVQQLPGSLQQARANNRRNLPVLPGATSLLGRAPRANNYSFARMSQLKKRTIIRLPGFPSLQHEQKNQSFKLWFLSEVLPPF